MRFAGSGIVHKPVRHRLSRHPQQRSDAVTVGGFLRSAQSLMNFLRSLAGTLATRWDLWLSFLVTPRSASGGSTGALREPVDF